MFEDIKGVIRSRTSKKHRQYNGQRKNDKKTTIDKALLLKVALNTKNQINRFCCGVRVAHSFLGIVLCRSLSFCHFSFGHCIGTKHWATGRWHHMIQNTLFCFCFCLFWNNSDVVACYVFLFRINPLFISVSKTVVANFSICILANK
jgi:hypothetical protein